jgi:hypothetical protein
MMVEEEAEICVGGIEDGEEGAGNDLPPTALESV